MCGVSVVNGYGATFGCAAEMCPSKRGFARVRITDEPGVGDLAQLEIKVALLARRPLGVAGVGAWLRGLLKCALPMPPLPPLQSTNSCPALRQVRDHIQRSDRRRLAVRDSVGVSVPAFWRSRRTLRRRRAATSDRCLGLPHPAADKRSSRCGTGSRCPSRCLPKALPAPAACRRSSP